MNLLITTILLIFFSAKADSTCKQVNTCLSDLPGYKVVKNVTCEGRYPMHLQGIVAHGDAIYWSFTNQLVMTDMTGKVLKKVDVPFHHGDLTYYKGKIYVAVGFGKWNHIDGLADSWIYEYRAADLQETKRYKIPELVYGAGGIVMRNKVFYVVGGLPDTVKENYIYEYDENFGFKKRHTLESGHTKLGIQTIEYHDGNFWLGCYGDVKLMLVDKQFQVLSKDTLDASLGISSRSVTELWIGSNKGNKALGYTATATLYKKK